MLSDKNVELVSKTILYSIEENIFHYTNIHLIIVKL